MKTRSFRKKSIIDTSRDELFQWHMSKDSLDKLIPPWEPVQVASQPEDLSVEGAKVVLEITIVGPFKMHWIARHQNIIPGKQFQDFQVKGPFAHWVHTHQFKRKTDHTSILNDKIEYALPMGTIGDFLGNWFVKRKLRTMFDYRHEITKKEFQ